MFKELFKYPPETPEHRMMWEVFFLLTITVAVAFLAKPAADNAAYDIAITIIFAVNLLVRFVVAGEKGDWLFFLFGVIAGGGNDLMSMLKGVYSYTSVTFIPFLADLLPLWMILFWGQVFLVFRKVFNLPWFKGEPFKPEGRFLKGWVNGTLIFDLLILIALRITIYNTYAMEPWISSSIYALFIVLRFLIIKPKKNELALMAILPYAFMYEGLLVTFGLYLYINPVFLGMPLWLFLWWIFLIPTIVKELFDRLECYLSLRSELVSKAGQVQ